MYVTTITWSWVCEYYNSYALHTKQIGESPVTCNAREAKSPYKVLRVCTNSFTPHTCLHYCTLILKTFFNHLRKDREVHSGIC